MRSPRPELREIIDKGNRRGAGPAQSAASGPRGVEWEEWTDKELAAFRKLKVGTIHSWLSRGVEVPPYVRVGSITRWNETRVREGIGEKEQTAKNGTLSHENL